MKEKNEKITANSRKTNKQKLSDEKTVSSDEKVITSKTSSKTKKASQKKQDKNATDKTYDDKEVLIEKKRRSKKETSTEPQEDKTNKENSNKKRSSKIKSAVNTDTKKADNSSNTNKVSQKKEDYQDSVIDISILDVYSKNKNIVLVKEQEDSNNTIFRVVHGNPTSALAFMNHKGMVIDKLADKGTLIKNNVTLVMSEISKLTSVLGIGVHKLFTAALYAFTNKNFIGTTSNPDSNVSFSLADFARNCGYELDTDNSENNKFELDNARKKVKKDLQLLFNISLSWKEKDGSDYLDTRLITSQGIRKGKIIIEFTPKFTNYLNQLPLTSYPTALLKIDDRNANGYAIGCKIAEHYSIYKNHETKTHNKIKVKTLLKITNLPSIEDLAKNRLNWKTRIKAPFEKSLNSILGESGILKSWKYITNKKVDIEKDVDAWLETLIHFEMNTSFEEDFNKMNQLNYSN